MNQRKFDNLDIPQNYQTKKNTVKKINHQPYGKENVHYHPVKPPTRGESTTTVESSPQEQSRTSSRNIKRKVLRRKDGEPRVFDESFTTNESGRFDRS